MASDRWRLFFALPIPEEVSSDLVGLQEELKALTAFRAKNIRWSRLEHLHLTLAFFASLEPSRIANLGDAARAATKAFQPFPIHLQGIGVFPRTDAARVIWVGVSPSKQLLDLQSSLAGELQLRGFSKEQRDFLPHLTLARLREGFALKKELAIFNKRDLGNFIARELQLYRSLPSSAGSYYELIERFPLGFV